MSNTVASRKYHIDFQSPDGGYSYVIMMGMVLLLVNIQSDNFFQISYEINE